MRGLSGCATSGQMPELQWGHARMLYPVVTLQLFGRITFSFIYNKMVLYLKMILITFECVLSLAKFENPYSIVFRILF
jgi:hypothetical protein